MPRVRSLKTLHLVLALVTALSALPVWAQEQGAAAAPPGEALELTLRDAAEMALRHNLQVHINKFAPEIQAENITSARARFDPSVTFDVPSAFGQNTSQGTTTLAGGDIVTDETFGGGFGFSHLLEYGTNYSINWTAQRRFSTNSFSTFNPNFSTNLRVQLTQPLLRNFGKESNVSPIVIAQDNLEVSMETFRSQVQQTLLTVYQAYWQLVFAEDDLAVKELSLDLARQQLERNIVQVEIGTLAPIETIQAEQQVASNELLLTQAQQALADARDDLRRLLNVDASAAAGWDALLVAADEPQVSGETIDLQQAIDQALERDPQLRSLRIGARTRALSVRTARNEMLPQVNFSGSLVLSGQGGDTLIRSGGFLSSDVVEIQEGGFSDALRNMFSADFRNWQVGLQVQFPINNWAAKAQHAQAIINERQQLMQIADREQQLRVDITKAVRQVTSGAQQVAQATVARELAERQLDAEERKFAVGTTTNFEVLTFQRDLANARTSELQAITNYMNSVARLEQAKGTLLESLGMSIGMAGVSGRPR
ncbi:MAG TPA: TolC family protein [Acidobacteriota bacterium]|nr:TolC family protein [Acidobacteriota bacterium]